MGDRRYRLDDDDVAAMFAGKADTRPALNARAARRQLQQVVPRHCQACGEIRGDLLSFRGDRDWWPVITADSPVRPLVKMLRARDHTPWVLLCTYCIDHAHIYVPES